MCVRVCVGGCGGGGMEILVVFWKRVVNFCIVGMYTIQKFQNNGSEIQIVMNTYYYRISASVWAGITWSVQRRGTDRTVGARFSAAALWPTQPSIQWVPGLFGGGTTAGAWSGPPSLLYNGYRVCLAEVQRPGHGVDHPSYLMLRSKKE